MKRFPKSSSPLKIGFLPTNDCAPIVLAQELGLYQKFGLEVELYRKNHWETIRDMIATQQLHAAHAPSVLPFLMRLGITDESCRCVTGMILSLGGNAITLSLDLCRDGVYDATDLRERILRECGTRTYTFGVALPFSAQYNLLCEWLRQAGIIPAVRIINVASTQLFPLLKLGYLDGYCAGEPWTSLAVDAGIGTCVATSASLAPLHPEKVLMVQEEFAETRREEHELLIAALLEACAYCDCVENRSHIAACLAEKRFIDAPADCIRAGFTGQPHAEADGERAQNSATMFSRFQANDPTVARERWITSHLYRFSRWTRRPAEIDRVFRRDAYLNARNLLKSRKAWKTAA